MMLKKFKVQKSKFKSQSGITLLISVMVLSGLTMVSLAVAAFASQEIRASRAVVLAEPAIAAAASAGEQGLWVIKRGQGSLAQCDPNPNNPPATVQLSNGSNSSITSCKSYAGGTFVLEAGVPFTFYLYDPNNVNGNIDLLSFPFNFLTVDNQSAIYTVTAHVTRLDGTPITPEPAGQAVVPNGFQSIVIPAVIPGAEGRIQVTLQSAGDATVAIDTNQGLPNFPTVNAAGCASRTNVSNCNATGQELFSRKINIIVPQ